MRCRIGFRRGGGAQGLFRAVFVNIGDGSSPPEDEINHFIIFPRRVQQKRRYRFVKNGNAFLLYELLLHCLGLDLHCPAAEFFVNAVRNGKNGAPRGGAAQRFEHARFGLRVEIRGDLVQ